MSYRTLNTDEVAGYLHLERPEIERMAKRGEIPHHRHGSTLVFRKSEIDVWASQRLLALHPERLSVYHKEASKTDEHLADGHAIIPEMIRPEWIVADLHARTKPSVIREMALLADSTQLVVDSSTLLPALESRERMASTALGGGVALLHPAHQEPYQFDASFMVLAKTLSPVPFGSPDGQSTDVFFLICMQDDRIHLHTLSRICMMCHSTSLLMDLREVSDNKGMYEALIRSEQEVIQARAKTAVRR